MATQNNLSERSVSVSVLAQDPLAAVAQGEGFAVAVLNRDQQLVGHFEMHYELQQLTNYLYIAALAYKRRSLNRAKTSHANRETPVMPQHLKRREKKMAGLHRNRWPDDPEIHNISGSRKSCPLFLTR